MYLRAFADPSSKQGELWRYGPGFKPQVKAPKGVAWEDYFYDAAAELPPEDNDIEDFFAEAETIAAPRLQKLREGDINLSDQERSELATFISLLLTRTRAHREMVNTIVSKLHVLGAKETLETPGGVEDLIETNVRLGGERLEVHQVRDALQAVVDGNVKVEQSSKAWTIKQIFEQSDAVDDLIASMHWNLLKAPEGHAFITSDNPVLITDPIGRMQGRRATGQANSRSSNSPSAQSTSSLVTSAASQDGSCQYRLSSSPSSTRTRFATPTRRSTPRSNPTSCRRRSTSFSRTGLRSCRTCRLTC